MNTYHRINASKERFSMPGAAWRMTIYQLAIVILLLSFSPASFSNTPYCSNIFFNGLITHGDDGHIQFERNAQLSGNLYYGLFASKVTSDYYSPKRSCGDFFCVAVRADIINPLLIPQKDTNSSNDFFVPANKKMIIGNNVRDYGNISVGPNATISFAPHASGYTIDELHLEHKSKLQLSAGEYWVNNLDLAEEGSLEIVGAGKVTLYVINDATIPAKFKINSSTKDPAKLVIYSFGSLNFATSSKTYAFIYSLTDVKLEQKAKLVGALMAKNIYLASDSQVTFSRESLSKLQFGDFCEGAPPTRDFTPPVIQLDPFSYNTLASNIIISGEITDPDNGARWLDWAFVSDGITRKPLLVNDEGRFSIELPLASIMNRFEITAMDKSYNITAVNFTVWRETTIEFAIKVDSYEFQPSRPIPVSGVISTPAGKVIKSAFVITALGDVPLHLINNRFTFYPPIVAGYNEYLIVARDQDGNEISEMIYIDGSAPPVTGQVRIDGRQDIPEQKLTGFIYSFWAQEDLLLTIRGIPQALKKVAEGVYEFETDIVLSDGRNRPSFIITTPAGETEVDIYLWYDPDRIFLTVNEPLGTEEVTSETIVVSGTLHIPLELIRKNMSLIVTSNRFPGIEYPVSTPTLSENGWSDFLTEIPLLPGENHLSVKVKQGKKDADAGPGVSRFDVKIIRN